MLIQLVHSSTDEKDPFSYDQRLTQSNDNEEYAYSRDLETVEVIEQCVLSFSSESDIEDDR